MFDEVTDKVVGATDIAGGIPPGCYCRHAYGIFSRASTRFDSKCACERRKRIGSCV